MTGYVLAGGAVAAVCGAATLAIWLGYPLLIRLLGTSRRRRQATLPPWETAPTVSVILATREPPEAVADRVRNLLDTSHPSDRLQVVVSIDAAADPVAYAQDDARVRVVLGDAPGGKWANLNAGVRAATGEVLVFADSAQRFDRGTISALLAPLAPEVRPVMAAVTGWLELPAGVPAVVRWYWRMERALRRDEATLHSSIGVTGAVWAMRRTLWAPLPAQVILDDLYTPMRLVLMGHRIAVSEAAVAHEQRAPVRAAEFQRKVRTLTGVFQVCAFLPGVLQLRRNPVWAQFVAHKLLRLTTPWLVLAGGAGTAVALGAALWEWFGARGVVLAAGVLAAGAVLRPVRAMARQVFDALHLQFAALRAAQNAARGRWDVWR
ncbi:MAG: glycosyltransferase [Gemmatimonadaceae bacterium]